MLEKFQKFVILIYIFFYFVTQKFIYNKKYTTKKDNIYDILLETAVAQNISSTISCL